MSTATAFDLSALVARATNVYEEMCCTVDHPNVLFIAPGPQAGAATGRTHVIKTLPDVVTDSDSERVALHVVPAAIRLADGVAACLGATVTYRPLDGGPARDTEMLLGVDRDRRSITLVAEREKDGTLGAFRVDIQAVGGQWLRGMLDGLGAS